MSSYLVYSYSSCLTKEEEKKLMKKYIIFKNNFTKVLIKV